MIKIGDLELYVGTKEEYFDAIQQGMKIVCALNRAKGYVTHQSIVGWQGRGCNPDNPFYLYKKDADAIYLNMIDGDNPMYVNDEMIDAALDFIDEQLSNGSKVFIYCSHGESRSPSIALMYLLQHKIIPNNNDAIHYFKNKYYPGYFPKSGNLLYIKKRWGI
jgi:hypothetical protein